MPSAKNPFTTIRWLSCCSTMFGIFSVIVGISEMCVWLAVLGVYGTISKDGKNWIYKSPGEASGFALVFLSACGLWCGMWVLCTGICGCCMRVGQPSDKNNRTRIVVCIGSGFNAFIFCPVQIALYAFLFKAEIAWFDKLYLLQPVWWAITLQAIGIASGIASFIVCVISIAVTMRIKPYAGVAKTWTEYDL